MDKISAITLAIAVWGAVLSTYTSVRDHMRTRGRARVDVGYGVSSNRVEGQPLALRATIANIGMETLFLRSAQLRGDGGLIMETPPFEFELRRGDSYTVEFEADTTWSVASYGRTKAVRVAFYDQLGRSYSSRAIMAGVLTKEKDGWSLRSEPWPRRFERLRERGRNAKLPPA